MENTLPFKTTDILLAALLNQFFGIDHLERDENSFVYDPRYLFVFKNSVELQEKVLNWQKKTLQVEPRSWYASLKQLKNMATLDSAPRRK